jgi:hypothetical protein
MAAADFPNSPTVGQSFTVDNKTYEWNGTFWEMAISTATIADGSIEGVKLASMSASVGDFLGWDGTEWGPAQVPVISSLDDISDVSAPSPTTGDVLKWSGTAWVSDQIDLGSDTSGNYMLNISAGTGISVDHTPAEGSSASVSLNATLNDLTDVLAPSPANGQFLKYSSTLANWVPDAIDLGTDTTGNYVSDVTAGTGITITHTPGEGSNPTIAVTANTYQPSLIVSDAIPTSPVSGQFWYESDTGRTFVYYDSYWVEIGGQGGPQGPAGSGGGGDSISPFLLMGA